MTHKRFLSSLSHVAIVIALVGLMSLSNSASAQKSRVPTGQLVTTTDFAPTTPYCESDFTGDLMTDIVFFNPSLSNWSIDDGHGGLSSVTFATMGDQPVAADYDGDHIVDITVVRTDSGLLIWKTVQSSDGALVDVVWGVKAEVPVQGDYDGDGKTDPAVWRPSDATWNILASSTGGAMSIQFGLSSDVAVPGDYDGDGITDLAVFRQSENTFYFLSSIDGRTCVQRWEPILRGTNEVFVPADYDGDAITDFAVFDAQVGMWSILESSTGNYRFEAFDFLPRACLPWETCHVGDYATPADYDNDGKVDPAVWSQREAAVIAHTSSSDIMKFTTIATSEAMPVSALFMTQ